jgi:hypothetical protein
VPARTFLLRSADWSSFSARPFTHDDQNQEKICRPPAHPRVSDGHAQSMARGVCDAP